eukprot:12415487-Alexandrium_andersonii.AAC.1
MPLPRSYANERNAWPSGTYFPRNMEKVRGLRRSPCVEGSWADFRGRSEVGQLSTFSGSGCFSSASEHS